MLALVALIMAVLVFFTLYEQTYGSWITFTDRLLTKDLFGMSVAEYKPTVPWALFSLAASPVLMVVALVASDRGREGISKLMIGLLVAGLVLAIAHDVVLVPQTAGSLTFLGAFFIVLLAPIFAWLWPWLERRGLNPSTPVKMAMGLFAAGLSFVPMVLGAQAAADGALASVWWLVLAYFLLEVGEVCLSPIGLSAVTSLSVARVVGVMMGAFWLATAYSEVLAAQFGKLASLDLPEGAAIDMAEASAKYADLFMLMGWIGIGAGLVALVASPWIRRAMHGVK
jgi:proton-dependent oligopeptide transporter, POT family